MKPFVFVEVIMTRTIKLPEPTGVEVTCKTCGETKDEHLFKYQKGKRCGYKCRACDLSEKKKLYSEKAEVREAAKLRAKLYRLNNPEQYKAAKDKYVTENREELLRKKREYRERNIDIENARCREWYYKNKDTDDFKQKRKANLDKNKIVYYAVAKEYYYKNKERILYTNSIWRKNNRHIVNYHTMTYYATRDSRTPVWADKDLIKDVYANCPVGMEVDHIIPLRGVNVCGLHVHNNLQYLSKSENAAKGNKFDTETI